MANGSGFNAGLLADAFAALGGNRTNFGQTFNQIEDERRMREARMRIQKQLSAGQQPSMADIFAADPKSATTLAAQSIAGPKVYGDPTKGMYTFETNPETGKKELNKILDPQGIGSGPFSGSGIASQDSNILLTLGPRIAENDPTLTQLERNAYNLSYARMSKPQRYTVPDGQGGMMMVEQPPVNLSTFPSPSLGAAANAAANGQVLPSGENAFGVDTPQKLGGGTIIGRKVSAQTLKDKQGVKNANKMLGNLNSYRNALREAGGFDMASGIIGLPTDAATNLSAKAEALRLDLKNLYELGALVGGDFQILDNLLTNPNTVKGLGTEVFGSLETQLDSLENQLRADMQTKGYELAGTDDSPIIARTQQDFDAAPINTYVLMIDEQTGKRRLVYKR